MNKAIELIKHRIIIIFFYVLRIVPIKRNKIVISSFAGKEYGSEGKAICDILLKQKQNYDIVWLCSNTKTMVPKGIRKVKYNSVRSVYELATAKVWIDNRRKEDFIRKRDGQYYIQTWHGNVCIKKVEKDATSLPVGYHKCAIADSKMADLFVSGSKWRDKNYREAFWYTGEIIHGDLYGSELLIENHKTIKHVICDSLRINREYNIALYAPTFRQDSRIDCYDIDYNRLINSLESRFGGTWVIIIRLHPNVAFLNDRLDYNQSIINGSLYPQSSELIAASDLLLSDYSGVIFDGFRFEKKVVLYASDLKRYLDEERDLYFDFNDLPSPISQNNSELNDIIAKFDEELYEKKRRQFVEELGFYKEDAAKITADIIQKEITRGDVK